MQVELTGQTANDFRDRRDVLMDSLSKLVGVTSTENTDGSINVTMGAQVLVNGTAGQDRPGRPSPNAGNSNYVDITYGSGGPSAHDRHLRDRRATDRA